MVIKNNFVPRILSYPPYGARERETSLSLSLSLSLRRAGRREPWERGCIKKLEII